VLVTGGPGIGKTDIIKRATRDLGADMILSHPAVADPTDIKGLPWIGADSTTATFLPFGELSDALRASRLTVWVLDDLGQAPASVQASFMQLLLARRVNGHVLPDCVTFVAATNRRTDRAGVSGILEPVKSRFATIVELTPDLDDWCSWAFEQPWIPAELIAFLRFRPALFNAFAASADLTNSPTPRTWANAAHLLGMGLPASVEAEAIAGAVGGGAAAELMAFLRLYRDLPSIDAILIDPDSQALPTNPGTLYAVATALASRATPANFGRVARYAQRLLDAKQGDMGALLVRDSLRRQPAVTQTAEFSKLVSGPLGRLMSGEEN